VTNVSSLELSGADPAREALRAAKLAAKTRPAAEPATRRKRRLQNAQVHTHREPVGLGGIFAQMLKDSGWDVGAASGDLLADWPVIAPELAAAVVAERFDQDAGCLHLRPASYAYATQLTMLQVQLVKRINGKLGRPLVRSLRVLPVGRGAAPATASVPPPAPRPTAPVRTGAPMPAALTALFDRAAAERAAAASEQARLRDVARSILPPYVGPPLREPDEQWAPLRDYALEAEGLTPESTPAAPVETAAERSRRLHEAALAVARRERRTDPTDPKPLGAVLRAA
jgi:predicted nucleic acid-binding Zn ribbon protein